jgi:hypothetical protein
MAAFEVQRPSVSPRRPARSRPERSFVVGPRREGPDFRFRETPAAERPGFPSSGPRALVQRKSSLTAESGSGVGQKPSVRCG